MDILATRALKYVGDNGREDTLVLTIYRPYKADSSAWRAGFAYGPPINRKPITIIGIDFIQALLGCLEVARGFLNGSTMSGRVNWQGMEDCGLPWHTDARAPVDALNIPGAEEPSENLAILTNRVLGYVDESGIEHEGNLTIYAPFQTQEGTWKCGFTFDPSGGVLVYYGLGADFLESLLDGLAKARILFDSMTPQHWPASESGDVLDCAGLPYKIGRAFWIESDAEPQNAGWERSTPGG